MFLCSQPDSSSYAQVTYLLGLCHVAHRRTPASSTEKLQLDFMRKACPELLECLNEMEVKKSPRLAKAWFRVHSGSADSDALNWLTSLTQKQFRASVYSG